MPHPSPLPEAQVNPWSLAQARQGTLDVGDGHRLWWASGGPAEPASPPTVLVIHGGPGGRSRDEPLAWLRGQPLRWLCWDQRGCGRSEPAGTVEANTLAHLLADIDRLLDHHGLAQVALLAGSWGAVPALEYARTRPSRVHGLLLRSAFLGSVQEVEAFFAAWPDWLGDAGAAWLGEETLSRTGALGAGDVAGSVSARLAWAWGDYEARQAAAGGLAAHPARFTPPPQEPAGDGVPGLVVQAHFLRHGCFLPPDARARWAAELPARVAGPITLVHGLDDAVCPVANSRWLAALWPRSRLELVAGAGHRMGDAALAPTLFSATQAWCEAVLANSV